MNSSTTFLVAWVNPEYNGSTEFQTHVFTSHVANWRIQNANSCCETVARFSFAKDLPLNARVRWHPRNVDLSRKQVFAKKNSLSAKILQSRLKIFGRLQDSLFKWNQKLKWSRTKISSWAIRFDVRGSSKKVRLLELIRITWFGIDLNIRTFISIRVLYYRTKPT